MNNANCTKKDKESTGVKLYDLKPILQMKASAIDVSMGKLIRDILDEWVQNNITEDEKRELLTRIRDHEKSLIFRSFVRVRVDHLQPILKKRALEADTSIYEIIRGLIEKDLSEEEKQTVKKPYYTSTSSR